MVNPFLTFPLYLLVPTLISGLILYTVILRLIPDGAGDTAFLALAAGSTIAGNLTIPGAASNIIIIQNAEHRGATITFIEFPEIQHSGDDSSEPGFSCLVPYHHLKDSFLFPCKKHQLLCKGQVQCDLNGRQNSA